MALVVIIVINNRAPGAHDWQNITSFNDSAHRNDENNNNHDQRANFYKKQPRPPRQSSSPFFILYPTNPQFKTIRPNFNYSANHNKKQVICQRTNLIYSASNITGETNFPPICTLFFTNTPHTLALTECKGLAFISPGNQQ
jgi:hypothetical protein